MKEMLINPPFHSLMGQDQSYVPLSLLWAANDAEDPGIYNFEINDGLKALSFLIELMGLIHICQRWNRKIMLFGKWLRTF